MSKGKKKAPKEAFLVVGLGSQYGRHHPVTGDHEIFTWRDSIKPGGLKTESLKGTIVVWARSPEEAIEFGGRKLDWLNSCPAKLVIPVSKMGLFIQERHEETINVISAKEGETTTNDDIPW